MFKGFQVRKKVNLMFWTATATMKGKCSTFSDHKQKNKVGSVHLERQLQEDRYGWCIFNLKCQKMEERTYFEKSKQQKTYPWPF